MNDKIDLHTDIVENKLDPNLIFDEEAMSKKGEIEASMRNCCGRVLLFESERQ
jgi:hypothetical protein